MRRAPTIYNSNTYPIWVNRPTDNRRSALRETPRGSVFLHNPIGCHQITLSHPACLLNSPRRRRILSRLHFIHRTCYTADRSYSRYVADRNGPSALGSSTSVSDVTSIISFRRRLRQSCCALLSSRPTGAAKPPPALMGDEAQNTTCSGLGSAR